MRKSLSYSSLDITRYLAQFITYNWYAMNIVLYLYKHCIPTTFGMGIYALLPQTFFFFFLATCSLSRLKAHTYPSKYNQIFLCEAISNICKLISLPHILQLDHGYAPICGTITLYFNYLIVCCVSLSCQCLQEKDHAIYHCILSS